ncbi:MAG: hypothetical protein ACRDJH_19390 [Thermomicrobiales bacterium]
MVLFPLLATLISAACAAVIGHDAWRRSRPHKVVWTIAFAVFALAAGAKTASMIGEWTPLLARTYYLFGAVLVVAYLAIGELYLLTGVNRRFSAVAPGAMLLLTALAATIVWNATIDDARLPADGWEAIDRGSGLGALAAILNSVSTLVLVGGVLYSAWRFRQVGGQRHRMVGCILIAAGTLIVAAGGTATRFGQEEYYYIPMSIGVATIFAGYLQTRRSDTAREELPMPFASPAVPPAVPAQARGALVSLPAVRGVHRNGAASPADPAITFIEQHFLPLDDDALAEACRVWSASPPSTDAFTRDEARLVWSLRLRLSPAAQSQFDAHSPTTRRQLAELYHDLFAPGVEQHRTALRG